MSKKYLLIVMSVSAVLGLIIASASINSPAPRAEEVNQAGPPVPHDELTIEKMVIETRAGKKHNFTAEIARTPSEQAYGLMNRTKMDANHGMLFLFQTEDERSFWMKNTLIPLDMVFIRADGTIHSIHESAIPHDLTPIMSGGPVLAVLELNGGRTADLGIQPGDRVFHHVFKPQE